MGKGNNLQPQGLQQPLPQGQGIPMLPQSALSMPITHTRGAPESDGSSTHIHDFLDEFELHALRVNLSEALKCWSVVKYGEKKTRELWEQLPGFKSNDWAQYNEQILSHYEIDAEKKFKVSDLIKWVSSQKRKSMKNLADFFQYDRPFNRIALWLKAKTKMAQGKIDRHFRDGFPSKIWKQIYNRLVVSLPLHDGEDPYTYSEIRDAAVFVFWSLELSVRAVDESDDSDKESDDDDSDDEEDTHKQRKSTKTKKNSTDTKHESGASRILKDLASQIQQTNRNQEQDRKEYSNRP